MNPTISSDSSNPFFLKKALVHALASSLFFLLSLLIIIYYNAYLSPAFSFFASYSHPSNGGKGEAQSCDYSDGRWVHDVSYPQYYTEGCPFLDPGFRCRSNGRNDTHYLQWRWKPHRCNLPRFDASMMLEKSRNKRILFVGDSIGRNQWESLICMLWVGVANKSRIYEKDGKPISKHKGYFSIFFKDYNLTVEYYRAPFLVAIGRPLPNFPSIVHKAIHIDMPHWESKKWVGGNVVVFNAGHWWNYDKIVKNGTYFQTGSTLNMTMDVKEAYRRTIQTIKQWADEKLQPGKNFVFFRSYSQAHYSNGTWNTGGDCNNDTAPKSEGPKTRQPEPWSNQVISGVLKEMKARENKNIGFLNITYLTEQRSDAHPSKYREEGMRVGTSQDCSHWCLPGVPDTWNEILFAHLISKKYGGMKDEMAHRALL